MPSFKPLVVELQGKVMPVDTVQMTTRVPVDPVVGAEAAAEVPVLLVKMEMPATTTARVMVASVQQQLCFPSLQLNS